MKKNIVILLVFLAMGNIYAQQTERVKKPLEISEGVSEVEDKIYLLVNKSSTQKLTISGTDYAVIYDGTISGINIDKVRLNAAKDELIFPPNRAFKVTGSIGVRGGQSDGNGKGVKPGYITSQFQLISGGKSLVTTRGYTESSTELFDDGGVNQPIIIFTSNADGAVVKLNVRYGGGNAGPDGYYLAGLATTSTIGTYILIEEL